MDETANIMHLSLPRKIDIHRCKSATITFRRATMIGAGICAVLCITLLILCGPRMADEGAPPIMSVVTLIESTLMINSGIATVYFFRLYFQIENVYRLVDARAVIFIVPDTEETRVAFVDLYSRLEKIVKRGRGIDAANLLHEIAERYSMDLDASGVIGEYRALAKD